MTDWPQEHTEYLIAKWGTDSATQIGAKLDGRSKSSVVGKAHRIGLPQLSVTPLPKGQHRRRPPPKRVPPGPDTLPRPPCLHTPAATIPTKRKRTPPPTQPWVPTVHPCCWPEGELRTPNFRYCDDPAEPGRPYCAKHVKLAYVKRRDRREDAD